MPEQGKMICPDCGVEMNRHAEKIDYSALLDSPGAIDADFGGVLREVSACPGCGKTLARQCA